MRAWLLTHRLQRNDAKTEYLCFPSPCHLRKHGRDAIQLLDVTIMPVDCVCSLGVMLDTHLNVRSTQSFAPVATTSNRLAASANTSLYTEVCHSAVQSLVVSRLDYCDFLLIGLPRYQLQRLQKLQTRAVRLHGDPLLHILPCHSAPERTTLAASSIQRVKLKMLLYVYTKPLRARPPLTSETC